ncbi:MAG: hypothetical protein LQ346_005380, partial [Caloplaca aetnensis]
MAGPSRRNQANRRAKAARRARKVEVRAETSLIAGTTTGQEQLLQCRRWLGNERRVGRFAREAIAEVEKLFHKDPAVRTSHPFHELSLEAKQIVATLETEREEAAAGGNVAADWWEGPERKGVTHAEQKAFKTQKELFKHY